MPGLFTEIAPLLKDRALMLILSRAGENQISVSVVPKRLNEGENEALTTPLCMTGAAEELDEQFVSHLSGYVESHQRLAANLAEVQREMEEAAKKAREEARNRAKSKTTAPPPAKSGRKEMQAPPKPGPPQATLFEQPAESTPAGS